MQGVTTCLVLCTCNPCHRHHVTCGLPSSSLIFPAVSSSSIMRDTCASTREYVRLVAPSNAASSRASCAAYCCNLKADDMQQDHSEEDSTSRHQDDPARSSRWPRASDEKFCQQMRVPDRCSQQDKMLLCLGKLLATVRRTAIAYHVTIAEADMASTLT